MQIHQNAKSWNANGNFCLEWFPSFGKGGGEKNLMWSAILFRYVQGPKVKGER
jgi:hypothetical protein